MKKSLVFICIAVMLLSLVLAGCGPKKANQTLLQELEELTNAANAAENQAKECQSKMEELNRKIAELEAEIAKLNNEIKKYK